ncbi:MAG TPA: FHA domain-containing protein [Vicinamibacteria bacterium]
MAVVALEVNDAGLLALPEGAPRPRPESPAFALFENGAVLTGVAARARAQLLPRAVRDDYWDQLDTEPVGRPYPRGVTRADLAWAQLRAMQELEEPPNEGGAPELVLLVPGFWSASSLGLLLGVARAAGCQVRGLVDAAVAAACFAGLHPRFLHLDLTRHRAVLTTLEGGPAVRRSAVSDLPGLGTAAFEEAYAAEIGRRFVAETRFDPRHSGPSEQALHDRLATWLLELRSVPTTTALFAAGGREHQIDLARDDFVRAARPLHARLAEAIVGAQGHPPPLLLLSARASRQPGLVDHCRAHSGLELLELPYDAALLTALRHRERICRSDEVLPFVTSLPSWSAAPTDVLAVPTRAGQRPTHLLHGGVAHPLSPLGLTLGTAPPLGSRGLGLRREGIAPHQCSLVWADGELWLEDASSGTTLLNGQTVTGRVAVRAGDRLTLGSRGLELLLVAIEAQADPA